MSSLFSSCLGHRIGETSWHSFLDVSRDTASQQSLQSSLALSFCLLLLHSVPRGLGVGVFCRCAHWDWSSGKGHSGQFQLWGLWALFLKCKPNIILLSLVSLSFTKVEGPLPSIWQRLAWVSSLEVNVIGLRSGLGSIVLKLHGEF